MKGRLLRGCCRGLALLIAVVALVAGGVVSYWLATGHRVYSVQTGSMRPLLQPGDAVITSRVPVAVLQPGDIISFRDARQPGLIMTHRIMSVDTTHGQITTKGDNNPQPDLPILGYQVIGQAGWRAPRLGSTINWLRSPKGLVAAVYLPAVIIGGSILLRIVRRPRYCIWR